MNKTRLTIAVLFLAFLFSCTQHKEKTEIIIQLSEAEYVRSLSNYSNDSIFKTAFQQTLNKFNPAQEEFLSVLEKNISAMQPDFMLTSIFNSFEFRDKITFNSTNQEVIGVLNDDIKLAKQQTIQVLKKRIEFALPSSLLNKLEVIVNELPEKNCYSIAVNRKLDKDNISELMQTRGELGFWETYELSSIWDFLNAANNETKTIANNSQVNENDSLGNDKSLFGILAPAISHDGQLMRGSQIGTSFIRDTALVNQYLGMASVRGMLPRDLKLIWSTKLAYTENELVQLFAIKDTRDGIAPLTSDCIVTAKANITNQPISIGMEMNAEGAKLWSRMTRENIGLQIAMVVDNVLYSAPYVNSEIESGKSELTGDYTPDEATKLAAILSAGTLPKISVKIISINE